MGDFVFYEGRPQVRADFLGILLAVLLSASALFGCAQLARRLGGGWLDAGRALVPVLLLLPAFALVRALHDGWNLDLVIAWLAPRWLAVAVAALLLAATLVRFRRVLWRVLRGALLVASPFVAITFGRAVLGALTYPSSIPSRAAPPSPAPERRERVAWIVFDELDERLLFRERPPSLTLREFDRLRDVSLRASDAYPPAGETLISVPALTLGRVIEGAEMIPGSLDLRIDMLDGTSARWSSMPTVFSQVHAAGFDVRVVGWMLPYCTLFGAELRSCDTRPSYYAIHSHEAERTVAGSAAANILGVVPWSTRRLHRDDFEDLFGRARKLLSETAPGLLFVHLPVPHTPGIFDAAHGSATSFELHLARGYLGNLALADRALGEIRRDMESSGAWDRTTVIVTADHWWRDAAQLDGKMDHRVPFLVKPAGGGAAIDYAPAFDTVVTSELVLAVLRGEAQTTDFVAAWLDAHRAAFAIPTREPGRAP